MFGAIRRFAAAAVALVTRTRASIEVINRVHVPLKAPTPLRRISHLPGACRTYLSPNCGKTPRIKGAKDRSLKSRSNRRKAAR